MDRREAQKMLGAGGALVVASPVVLPTFRVAHAASPADTGLAGLPEPGDPLPFAAASFPTSRFKQKQVSIVPDMGSVLCADQSLPIITYEWRIMSVSWQKLKAAYLRITESSANGNDPVGGQLIAMPVSRSGFSGPTAYSVSSYSPDFLIRKGSSKGDVKIDRLDTYRRGPGALALRRCHQRRRGRVHVQRCRYERTHRDEHELEHRARLIRDAARPGAEAPGRERVRRGDQLVAGCPSYEPWRFARNAAGSSSSTSLE